MSGSKRRLLATKNTMQSNVFEGSLHEETLVVDDVVKTMTSA